MTRGGVTWDDSLCAHCSREIKVEWEDIVRTKQTVMNQQRSKERVLYELQRNSNYREMALKQGMIRPFLLLVAMPPVFRNQVACSLGWSTYTSVAFGDPHREAWDIIHKNSMGMQARVNKSYETLNPLAHNANWYEILVRVGKAGFVQKDVEDPVKQHYKMQEKARKQAEKDRQQHMAQYNASGGGQYYGAPTMAQQPMMMPMNQGGITTTTSSTTTVATSQQQGPYPVKLWWNIVPGYNWNQIVHMISDHNNPWIANIEQEFLSELAHMMKSQLTMEQRNHLKQSMTDPKVAAITDLFVLHAGVTKQDVLTYSLQVTKQMMNLPSTTSMLVPPAANMLISFAPQMAASIVPLVSVSMAALATPLFILGVLGLARTGLHLAFGSNEGRVFMAVAMILNQRLLLALEGIRIEDYY